MTSSNKEYRQRRRAAQISVPEAGMVDAVRKVLARHDRKKAEGWIKAEDIPVEMEGMRAWIYEPWADTVEMGWVPRQYSRDPRHCGGVMLWPVPRPSKP